MFEDHRKVWAKRISTLEELEELSELQDRCIYINHGAEEVAASIANPHVRYYAYGAETPVGYGRFIELRPGGEFMFDSALPYLTPDKRKNIYGPQITAAALLRESPEAKLWLPVRRRSDFPWQFVHFDEERPGKYHFFLGGKTIAFCDPNMNGMYHRTLFRIDPSIADKCTVGQYQQDLEYLGLTPDDLDKPIDFSGRKKSE